MADKILKLAVLVAFASTAALSAVTAQADDNPRNLVPSGRAENALTLSMTRLDSAGDRAAMRDQESSVMVGDKVRVCFESADPGYVTLWSHDAGGGVSRILPNEYTEGGEGRMAMELPAGEPYCVVGSGLAAAEGAADDTADWWFEVTEPAGQADLYLHWTATEDEQLPSDSFVDVDALGRAVSQRDGSNFTSAWFSYGVTRQ